MAMNQAQAGGGDRRGERCGDDPRRTLGGVCAEVAIGVGFCLGLVAAALAVPIIPWAIWQLLAWIGLR